jgi:hypothetical protein
MDRLERQAREVVKALGARGRTQRVPEAVRVQVVSYARAARERGVSWRLPRPRARACDRRSASCTRWYHSLATVCSLSYALINNAS